MKKLIKFYGNSSSLFHLVLILNLFGCSVPDKPLNEVNEQVVLVFRNIDGEQSFQERFAEIMYLDRNLIPQNFQPYLFGDSIYVIQVSRSYIEVVYNDKEGFSYSFLFKKGDSVEIHLKKKIPVATILNRPANAYQSNFEQTLLDDFHKTKSLAITDFYYYWNYTNNPISVISGEVIADELDELKRNAIKELNQQQLYINSLMDDGIVDDQFANYYKTKNDFNIKKLALYKEDKVDFGDYQNLEILIEDINTNLIDSSQLLASYLFHDDFISLYYTDLLDSIEKSTYIDNVLNETSGNSIFNSTILYKAIDDHFKEISIDEGMRIYRSLTSSSEYNQWAGNFHEKYNLDMDFNKEWKITKDPSDLLISTNTMTFGDLLDLKEGKVKYVNIWASWCATSILHFPSLEKLHDDYVSKGVDFISISVDMKNESWNWANNKFLKFSLFDSYLLVKEDRKTLKQTFNLEFIPRYILLDQEGNLIHANAPGPESQEIRDLFDKYIFNGR